jgi:4-hydroxy-2-oxoheptanedioate aldolase
VTAPTAPHETSTRLVGSWVKMPTVEVVEVLAVAGLDFVIVDLEHGAINIETASQMIGAAAAAGLRPLVRVPTPTAAFIQPLLDAGAAGIVVPHVDEAESARAAVRAIRFPPVGERGASPSGRAGGWGTVALGDYLAGGDDVLVIAQVESVAALASIEEIGSVPGIDMVFIGQVDLAASSGLGHDDPWLREQVAAAEEACRRTSLKLGGTANDGPDAADKFARGYALVTISTDLGLLRRAGSEAVSAVREESTGSAAVSGQPGDGAVPVRPAMRVHEEVLALVTAVWFEIDHTDGSTVSSHFTDDATLLIAEAAAVGTREIDQLYANRHHRGPRVSRHCATNLHIVEMTTSSVRAVSTLLLFAQDGEAPLPRMSPALVADVEDVFVRRAGRWLIHHRHIKPQFLPEEGGLAVPTQQQPT